MPYPFTVGKIRAAELNDEFRRLRPLWVIKPADQILSNSAALQNDTDLVLPTEANLTYRWELDISYGAGTVADFKWAFTFPSGSILTFVGPIWDASLAFLPAGSGSTASGAAIIHGGAGVGTFRGVILRGTLAVGSTAGDFQWQWAQNTATVENTVVKAGSVLLARQLPV